MCHVVDKLSRLESLLTRSLVPRTTYMTSHGSSNASLESTPLPPSLAILRESDIASPLVENKSPSAKSIWFTDAADIFTLICSFLLTAVSIVFVAFVFHLQVTQGNTPSRKTLSFLQRVISSLSVTITSAVIIIAGKRYVFFKLAKGGLRSRKVAVYSNPSIGALVSYLVLHGAELPLLGLSAVWVLGLVTSLTVDNSWEGGSIAVLMNLDIPSGPLYTAVPPFPRVNVAAVQLGQIQSWVCHGLESKVGLINITNADTIRVPHPSAIVYYAPPPDYSTNTSFSFPTTLNGFDFSVERLSSVPPTAQKLYCLESLALDLWLGGSDNQTLSIIAAQLPFNNSTGIFRFNATAIIMGGTLSSTGDYVEFLQNGTSWPNVMPEDSPWAKDITSLICNTPLPPLSGCAYLSLVDFAAILNNKLPLDGDTFYSAMSMALGAYTSAMYTTGYGTKVPATLSGIRFTSRHEIYILILHVVVSLAMLVVVMKLRRASPLVADFINSTRLLLDPLKKPEFFNISLETTLDALGDPYMMIGGGEFLVTEGKTTMGKKEEFLLHNSKLFDRGGSSLVGI